MEAANMKKTYFSIMLVLSLILFALSGCQSTNRNTDMLNTPQFSADSDGVSAKVTTEQSDSYQTVDISGKEVTGDEGLYSETSREEKLPAVGGDYTPLSRKYVDDAYDILPIIKIINDEAKVQEWVDNVLYAQPEDDMLRVPSLYQAVSYFGITKEELYAYNASLLEISPENPMVIPEYVIEALYFSDETEMMKELTNSFALYYDGAVYSYDEIINSSVRTVSIPNAVLSEYVSSIEPLMVEYYGQDVYAKEFQAAIDEVKNVVAK